MKNEIDIHILHIAEIVNNFEMVMNSLTREEYVRATKYKDIKRMVQEVGSILLVNKYSGEGELKYNEYSKPYKDNGLFFNISHSDSFIIIAVSDSEIGIDIEKVRTMKNDVIRYALSDEEYNRMDTIDDFFSMWTIKESVGKCIGIGLTQGIKNIPTESEKTFMGHNLTSFSYKMHDYVIGVTYEGFNAKDIKFDQVKIEELVVKRDKIDVNQSFETYRLFITPTTYKDKYDFIKFFDTHNDTFTWFSSLEAKRENYSFFPSKLEYGYSLKLKDYTLIGFIGIEANKETNISYFLVDDYRGYGYMREALSKMIDEMFKGTFGDIKSINAYICIENTKSINLVEKLGFNEVKYLEKFNYHFLFKKEMDYKLYRINNE